MLPGQIVKVVDENGKMLGPHEPGELLFKGTQRMVGYIGNDQATNCMIDQGGWLHTGDIGYFDEDKQFFIVDRLKELIKYKGFQVDIPNTFLQELYVDLTSRFPQLKLKLSF